MNQIPNIEEIEALSEKIHHLYCAQYEKDNGEPYWTKGDYSKLDERTKEYDRNIARFIHHQLQKAREEERFRLQKEILSCVTAEGDDCFFLRVAKDSPIFTQSELDQPTKLSNCIECGYPVPEYEEVSNCHSTCRLEV